MTAAGLDVDGPGWRAAHAAATLTALARAEIAPDDALGMLASCGEPPLGWLETLAGFRRARPHAVILLLPRPGDPRGQALPRGIEAGGLVGWSGEERGAWLAATDRSWVEIPGSAGVLPPDPIEADRTLRRAIVSAAHVMDAAVDDRDGTGGPGSPRASLERLVDAWIRGAPALPAARRFLAARGLRILLAIDDARGVVDVVALESAARTAVEAAYGSILTSG